MVPCQESVKAEILATVRAAAGQPDDEPAAVILADQVVVAVPFSQGTGDGARGVMVSTSS